MELASDFSEFCGSLNVNRVEYLVVGAYAMALHGVPRYTGDFDVYVRPTFANGLRVMAAIREFGFPTDALSAEDVIDPRRVIQMGMPPLQIHIMSEISGLTWEQAWAGREIGRFGELDVAFLGRTELIENKRAAGRTKDLADIQALTRQVD
ncbi:MAG: hypothetical protein GEV06_14895 [Luteitalea sp.]|nr:hypothetical protein [Luteitalea sp.]